MSDFPFTDLPRLVDVVFNGRPAYPNENTRPTVTIEEVVKRGTSIVRIGKKFYRITAEQIEVSK